MTTLAILLRLYLLHYQDQYVLKALAMKKALEEMSNQESPSQVLSEKIPRFEFLKNYTNPKDVSCIVFAIYGILYAIFVLSCILL